MKDISRTDDLTPLKLQLTEMAVIANLLCQPVEAWPQVEQAGLSCGSFTDPTCRMVFDACREAQKRYPDVWDAVSVAQVLESVGELDKIGGYDRLLEWPEKHGAWQGVTGTHAAELKSAETLRKIYNHTLAVQQTLMNGELTLEEKVSFATDIPDFRRVAGVSSTVPTAAQLIERHTAGTPVLIDGLLRERELMLVAAPSKFGKSFLTYSLIRAFLRGDRWLGEFDCFGEGKRVLLIDNEVQERDLTQRLNWQLGDCPLDRLHVHCVRTEDGRGDSSVATIAEKMRDLRPALTIIDAVYKAYPTDGRFDENSNADVTRFLATIESAAAAAGSAVVMIHHSTKGTQSGKHSRDVGAGAGAWTRSPDCQLAIVEHAEDDCGVVSANVRTFRRRDPIGIRLDRDTMRWEGDASLDVTQLKGQVNAEERSRKGRETKDKLRDETLCKHDEKVLRTLTQHGSTWLPKSKVRELAGLNAPDGNGALTRLTASGAVSERTGKRRDSTEYLLSDRVAEVAAAEEQQLRNMREEKKSPSTPVRLSGTGGTVGEGEADSPDNGQLSDCPEANDTGKQVKSCKGRGKTRKNRTASSKE